MKAFFQVAKDPAKPFFVYANELVTKVLGTSFNVRAYESDKNVVVEVKTGKVSVFSQSDKMVSGQKTTRELTGLILTPNQQVTYLRQEIRLIRSLVEVPTVISMPEENQHFEFSRIPIAQVFATLEKAYGVDIIFDEELMAYCTLTASLGKETLFKKLEWICAATGSEFEVVDGQILITSNGCK